MKLPKKCTFFGQRNVQRTSGTWEVTHELRCYPYLIPKSVDLKIVVVFMYGDSLHRDVQIKREDLLGGLNP